MVMGGPRNASFRRPSAVYPNAQRHGKNVPSHTSGPAITARTPSAPGGPGADKRNMRASSDGTFKWERVGGVGATTPCGVSSYVDLIMLPRPSHRTQARNPKKEKAKRPGPPLNRVPFGTVHRHSSTALRATRASRSLRSCCRTRTDGPRRRPQTSCRAADRWQEPERAGSARPLSGQRPSRRGRHPHTRPASSTPSPSAPSPATRRPSACCRGRARTPPRRPLPPGGPGQPQRHLPQRPACDPRRPGLDRPDGCTYKQRGRGGCQE